MKAFNPFGNVRPTVNPLQEKQERELVQQNTNDTVQPNVTNQNKKTSFSFDSLSSPRENNTPAPAPAPAPAPTINADKNSVNHNQTNDSQHETNKNKIQTTSKGGFRLDSLIHDPDINNKNETVRGKEDSDVPSFEEEKVKLSEYDEWKIVFNAKRAKVKDIKVTEIAKLIGATNREDKIRDKWKMPWGHNVSIKGQQWFNHNSNFTTKGGRDAVSFTKYVIAEEEGFDLDDSKQAWKVEIRAVNWLIETFGAEIDKSDILMAKEDFFEKQKTPYAPPKVLPQYLTQVIDYLQDERKLPLWIIQKQIDAGKIYAGIPRNFETRFFTDHFGKKMQSPRDLTTLANNEIYCIFKSGDDSVGAAECRCVKDENQLGFTKGFSEGSEKKYSGFLVVGEEGFEEKEIVLTESAIDSMSYQVLHPWAHTISTGGTDNSEFVMRIIREVLEHPLYKITLALDNDDAGNKAYEFIFEQTKKHYGKKFQAYLDSGKFSRKTPPTEKDWNKYLTTLSPEQLQEIYHKNTYVKAQPVVQQEPQMNTQNSEEQLKDLPLVEPTRIEQKRKPFVFNFGKTPQSTENSLTKKIKP